MPKMAETGLARIAARRARKARKPPASRRCWSPLGRAPASPALTLVTGIFGASPYLSRLINTNPAELLRCLNAEPLDYLRQSAATLDAAIADCRRHDEAMKPLREAKRRLALVTALADLGGVWDVSQVTAALSEGADALLAAAIRFLLKEAARQGKFTPQTRDAPEAEAAISCSAWANTARAS